jgi:hypothetical protein
MRAKLANEAEQLEAHKLIDALRADGWSQAAIGRTIGYVETGAGSMISKIRGGTRFITVDKLVRLRELVDRITTPQQKEAEMPNSLPAQFPNRLAVVTPAPSTNGASRPRSTLEDLKSAQETLRSLARRLTQTQMMAVVLMKPGLGAVITRLEQLANDLEV